MGVPSFQQLMLPALQWQEKASVSKDRSQRWAISWAAAKWVRMVGVVEMIIIACTPSVRAQALNRWMVVKPNRY